METPPPDRETQERYPDGRWVPKLGISKKIQPLSTKLPEHLDGVIRSLSEAKLKELCGSKDRAAYLRLAIVNQLKKDGLIPEETPHQESQSRTRKKKPIDPKAETS
jgi:hypothetical protein